ncbi:hypothetical protein GCM10025867_19430 [Frondihabitans sucicola]|uniref:Uncharacterized protein n=1 Tax=Frondihabitans sucicola TaxID=1268041 RepID=A0ABN6XXE7_9MICO|nr:hypothetical protein GCM10025867_19430 [Frondihabitans sucicola]
MSDTRRSIRLFSDWGFEWPLWENGHPSYNMEPADLGHSAELTARTRRWADDYESHLDINATPVVWRDSMTWNTWVEGGRRISELLG